MIKTSSTGFLNKIIWLMRIGVCLTFLGHGIIAFNVNPKWLLYLQTVGLTGEFAMQTMKFIGALDILIAISILIKPMKQVLYWCVFWAFLTALMRPLSGESILQFVERGANWILPLALVLLISIKEKQTLG